MAQSRRVTRRKALSQLAAAGSAGLAASATNSSPAQAQPPAPGQPFQEPVPIRGKAGPGLQPFDAAMLTIMDRHGIPGAALAVTKKGRLILAKGYGWADVAHAVPVEPDTLFGLASLSKPITAAAVLKLAEQQKLGLDDRVFDILTDIRPAPGLKPDPRVRLVTLRQCLNHTGGWDRTVKGDPVNWQPQICRAYKVAPPLTPRQFISFIAGLPLDFAPGTDAKYSNVGFILAGECVARVSGQPYETFVTEQVLKPMGIRRTHLHPPEGRYMVGEAIRHLAGTLLPLPPLQLPMVDACGGWSGSVVDMARFMTNLDGARGEPVLSKAARQFMIAPPPPPMKPRDNGTWFGLGWDSIILKDGGFGYFKDGSYQGMRTYMKRLPDGVGWALLYNASMEFDPQDAQIASGMVQEVRRLVEGLGAYPDIDLFKDFA